MGNDPTTAPPPAAKAALRSDAPDEYLIITGHGRSGSNRLLDAFDCHPKTFCRNEANSAEDSSLGPLRPGFFPSGDPEFASRWRKAFAMARREIGVRDRISDARKTYIDGVSSALARAVLPRAKARRAFSAFFPSLKRKMWPATALGYANAAKLDGAYPVLKMLICPGWILDVFDREPGMRVILNIRAPKPFLLSWRHRYVDLHTPAETVFRENMLGMEKILAHFRRADPSLEEYGEAALLRSELWRWRYIYESLYRAFAGYDRFTVSTYEGYDADPSGEARRLFAFAGLEMDAATESRIGALRNSLFPDKAPPYPHVALLDEIVADVLEGSPLPALWADEALR